MKLPIRTLGLAAVALLIGSALAPASAQQQQSGVDGQVALRSDGALYLISNGQRRWISTVAATDEEINALQEGDPIFAGLAPQGSSQASSGAAKPSTNTSSASSKPAPSKTTSKPTSGDDDDDDDSSSSNGEDLDSSVPITVDIGGSENLKRGDKRVVEIKTSRNVTCELKVKMPGGDDIQEDSKNADSSGRCKYNIEIPSGAKDGNGEVVGTVREGGKVNRSTIKIKIQK
jgi:hypothetical protein